MKREPDDLETTDDEDVMPEGRIVYVERPKKTESGWLMGVAASLVVLSIGAAWSANSRLAALEATVTDLRAELADVKRLVELRYRGGSNAPDAR